MKYIGFGVSHYKGISSSIKVTLKQLMIAPLLGENRSGKSSFLKGVYALDYRNDDFSPKTKHLEQIEPIKSNGTKQASVRAVIEFSPQELVSLYLHTLYQKYKTKLLKNIGVYVSCDLKLEKKFDEFVSNLAVHASFKRVEEPLIKVEIERIIPYDGKKIYYQCDLLSQKIVLKHKQGRKVIQIPLNELMNGISNKNALHQFCVNTVDRMPKMVFHEDFSQYPFPSELWLDNCYAAKVANPWYLIFRKMFLQNNENIDALMGMSHKNRISILEKISQKVNKGLVKYFETFGIGTLCPQIDLNYRDQVLEIRVGDRDNGFYSVDIYQQDKGTLWYLDFILKTIYLYGVDLSAENVYIFDNIGSYLSAQEQVELCKNISFLARKNKLLYSSMSHHLYNLGYIQLKSIYLLAKTDEGQTLELLKKSKSVKGVGSELMLQPIFEVLNLNNLDYFFAIDRPILLVEGMSDKFYLDLFLPQNTLNKFYIVASQGASTLYKNVQYMTAFDKRFVVLSDYDRAGLQGLEHCKEMYGDYPLGVYMHLPKMNGDRPTRIEDMLSEETRNLITDTLGLDRKVYKKSIVFTLYRSGSDKIDAVQKGISRDTLKNFVQLAKSLEKGLKSLSI